MAAEFSTVDFHSHLIPGVDDGASTLDESRAALGTMHQQGVRALVTTPHVRASLTRQPAKLHALLEEIDAAWQPLEQLAAAEFGDMRIARGAEVLIDAPDPDLSDPRLRLAGTPFVLVEFPFSSIPMFSVHALFQLKTSGWIPIVAHPERYSGLRDDLSTFEEWRGVGAYLQVNCGSLTGKYGKKAQTTAWQLLELGWVDYLSSDYHARGACAIEACRTELVRRGGAAQIATLMETNPRRMLAGDRPERVPALSPQSFWRRLLR